MRSIIFALLVFANLLFQACMNRPAEERSADSTSQAPVLENPVADSAENQIDSSSDTSKTIVENIADRPDMTRLTQSIEAAELTTSLTGAGPFTIFAPTDTAFSQAGLKPVKVQKAGPDEKMQKVLTYHLVSGFYRTDDLKQGMELTTVQGGKIRITLENGVYMVNGAPISVKNIIAKNGVIQVIDQILTPPDTVSKSSAAP